MTWLDFHFKTIPEAVVGDLRGVIGSREDVMGAPALCRWHMLAAHTALDYFLFQSPSLGGKKQRAQLLTPDL